MNGLKSLICLIVLGAAALVVCLCLGANNPQQQPNPILINTCLITTNVSRLVNFYENVLGMKARWSGEQYAEFQTGVAVLAIFSAEAQRNTSRVPRKPPETGARSYSLRLRTWTTNT